MTERFTIEEMTELAARAVRRIDRLGPRGATLCSMAEIEAMAALLVAIRAFEPETFEVSSNPASTGDKK